MSGDDDGFRSEREFMDALRVLKARSGLSYRDIATRMSRTHPVHAVARSTLAELFAGNVLPRRPGQVAALVEVLATELNEPGQTARYVDAWSRLISARSQAELPTAPAPAPPVPAPWAAAARAAASVRVPPPAAADTDAASPPGDPFGRPEALFYWLVALTLIAFVTWATLPAGVVPFWLMWLMYVWVLPVAALGNWLKRFRGRRPGHLSDVPTEYLRTEYRTRSRPTGSGPSGHWTRS